jgi:hypothetical protein
MFEEHDHYYDTRLALVTRINRERTARGLSPLEFDALSSTVADRHCLEMAAHQYLSHWDLQGLLPYHRYHFAGGRDYVQENLSRMTVISSDPHPISTEPSEILKMLVESHERFLAEKPPMDGHRQAVLDPGHTHVGIGLAVVKGEFTMAEEFVNRYVRLTPLPAELPNAPFVIAGEMLRRNFGPYYCVLFYEGELARKTVSQLERTYAYNDTDGDQCAAVRPWEMRFDTKNGQFRINIRAKDRGRGLYHLLLWVRNDIRTIPYELHAGGNRVDTSRAVAAAGWIFRR